MTRETKIGLLVGLAFIIVIGILLSDHLTTSTEPPPARLAQAGPSVRGGIAIPGATNTPPPVVAPPKNVTPSNPVPTPGDLAEATARAQQQEAQARQQAANQVETAGPAAPPVVVAANASDDPADAPGNLVIRHAELAAAARAQGEALMPVQAQPAASHPGSTQLVPTSNAGHRTYTAVSGDTLSGLAEKLLGHNTKANRQALIAANPSLKENPNLIIAGKTYTVPDEQVVKAVAQATHQATAPKHQGSERWYTVKAGDSLWRIAVDQTGSASTLDQLRQLNQQALQGKDVVRVGMKLRLPAGG